MINSILETVFYIAMIGSVALFVNKFIKVKKNSVKINDINKIQARISLLRISLKAKIKKKVNLIKVKSASQLSEVDPINKALNSLLDIPFQTNEDFQSYFDISKKIQTYIDSDNRYTEQKSDSETKPEKNTSEMLPGDISKFEFQNELSILKLLKEIVDLYQSLNKLTTKYKMSFPKSTIEDTQPLSFESLVELNRVFLDNEQT